MIPLTHPAHHPDRIFRHHPAVQALAFATLLSLAIGGGWLASLVATADAGVFSRLRVLHPYPKSQETNVLVRDARGERTIAGLQPFDLDLKPGDPLVKVPGELCFRVAPGWPAGKLPRWFQFESHGLIWIPLVFAAFAFAWIGICRTAFRFVQLDRDAGQLRTGWYLLPLLAIPAFTIARRSKWRCWVEGGPSWRVMASPDPAQEPLVIAVRGSRPSAAAIAADLASWVTPVVHADRLQSDPGLAARLGHKCPLCGTDEAGTWRLCTRCQTPYHRKCWVRHGHCTTADCGSRHLARPA